MSNYDMYNNLSLEQLEKEFGQACFDGDLGKIKYLLNSPKLPVHPSINCNENAYFKICATGNLQAVKYVFGGSELKTHMKIPDNRGLVCAATLNHLEVFKYLLNELNISVYSKMEGFGVFKYTSERKCYDIIDYLCFEKHDEEIIFQYLVRDKETVEYIMTHPLYDHDIKMDDIFSRIMEKDETFEFMINHFLKDATHEVLKDLFIYACDHFVDVEPLLTLLERRHEIDIHFYEDQIFKKLMMTEQMATIEKLIFNDNIELTPEIEKNMKPEVAHLFNVRKINQELESSLNEKKQTISTMNKI